MISPVPGNIWILPLLCGSLRLLSVLCGKKNLLRISIYSFEEKFQFYFIKIPICSYSAANIHSERLYFINILFNTANATYFNS
jgi:hypothetical protein